MNSRRVFNGMLNKFAVDTLSAHWWMLKCFMFILFIDTHHMHTHVVFVCWFLLLFSPPPPSSSFSSILPYEVAIQPLTLFLWKIIECKICWFWMHSTVAVVVINNIGLFYFSFIRSSVTLFHFISFCLGVRVCVCACFSFFSCVVHCLYSPPPFFGIFSVRFHHTI